MVWKKGYCWDTRVEANAHIKQLKKLKYGIRKRKVFPQTSIIMKNGKFCTRVKEGKGYLKWLRTGLES